MPIFHPLKLHRKSTSSWCGNLPIFSLRHIDVISSSNRQRLYVVCTLGGWFICFLGGWFICFFITYFLMINILYEMITILHEKMSNLIYLYWFHNDTLAENNSLNDHSNEPWVNGQRFVISPVKLNLLDIKKWSYIISHQVNESINLKASELL